MVLQMRIAKSYSGEMQYTSVKSGRSRKKGLSSSCLPFVLQVLFIIFATQSCSGYSIISQAVVKGSAAKPYEKKKVAVFGAGGYLGACIFGYLQRAGSLYGTGIAGIGAPRSITATSIGSSTLNSVLGKNFILAQADESFVKLTDMTSADSIRSKVRGFDIAILATRYTLETRPVTGGSYERTPNDKTMEFYMDRPRSSTVKGVDSPDYCIDMLTRSLEACRAEGIKRIVVIETDSQFDGALSRVEQYINIVEQCGVPFLYVQPVGILENVPDYTYAKGVQGDLEVEVIDRNNVGTTISGNNILYREDLAAFCVQSVLSLDWSQSKVVRVRCNGALDPLRSNNKPTNQQWCVNSNLLESLLSPLAQQ